MMARIVAVRDLQSIRSVAAAATAATVFGLVWLLRFNDPGGSFAGLTDDHFFYLIRGWQILFGDLPVRDFVDHGAPLYYYVGAAVQTIGGRGTLSEIAFSSAALALSAALICWLCGRASGWTALGVVGALFFVCLEPRYYNYPKFLPTRQPFRCCGGSPTRRTTARASGWRSSRWWRSCSGTTTASSSPRRWRRCWCCCAICRGASGSSTPRSTARWCCVMLAPYLLFIQRNGGIGTYFQQASAWAAARSRPRAGGVARVVRQPRRRLGSGRAGGRRGQGGRRACATTGGVDLLHRDRAAVLRALRAVGVE